MPRPKNQIPQLRTDRTGRAFTKVGGRFISLGKAGTAECQRRYAKVLEDHAEGRLESIADEATPAAPAAAGMTINELLLAFKTKEFPRFSRSEQLCFRAAMRLLRQMFGEQPVSTFGPLRFRLLREAMVNGDPGDKRKPWSRYTANRQAKRIRALFKWGVSWELVPQSVHQALCTVPSLAYGQTTAPESKPRLAVSQPAIDAVRAQLRPLHRDVFDLLLLTGARPGEILNLRAHEIDRSGAEWVATLEHHKTFHKGKHRLLVFNTKAQAILGKYLPADPAAKLFTLRRDNFSAVIRRACIRAKVTPFVPHQLRHTAATRVVDQVGELEAQRLLGHSSVEMTRHYSKAAIEPAKRGARALG